MPPSEQHTPWFQTWFDSEYYHLLYAHRDHKEAEDFIPRILKKINVSNDACILDLACGKGRHARVMQKLGYQVTGIDLSPNSIQEAKKQNCDNDAEFYVHDMRMPFRTNYFDVVMNLFTSFGYFETVDDERKTMQAIQSALKPNGILVIDYLNATKVEAGLPKNGEKQSGEILFSWQTQKQDGFVKKKIHVQDQKQHFDFEEKVRLITKEEFTELLEQENLQILHTFGNYRLEPYVREDSDRLIIVAGKKS